MSAFAAKLSLFVVTRARYEAQTTRFLGARSEDDSMGLPGFFSNLPNKGNTPVEIATSNGFEDIVELLEASSAKPN